MQVTDKVTIGFTGTRKGLTAAQHRILHLFMWGLALGHRSRLAVIHGDCVGADAQFDEICAGLNIGREIFPGDIPGLRAHCAGEIVHPPQQCMRRNGYIVGRCDQLIACPDGPERQRSGTWATVRKARKLGGPVLVIYPDGLCG